MSYRRLSRCGHVAIVRPVELVLLSSVPVSSTFRRGSVVVALMCLSLYVPCSVRSHLAQYIEECRALAIRRGDTDIDLALHNSEGNLCHVLFRHGRMSSKFHGSSGEELVNDYGLRHHDMMTVIPSLVMISLKNFLSIPRTGSLTLEIGLDSEDDDIYVSIPCSYIIGMGGTIVFKKEGFSNFLWASSIEVNNLVLITFKEGDQELAVIFNLVPQSSYL
ncbi:GATA transcription factor 13 [Hordeum vulgare]|nr:GATA transcription factor 13 [Hordeum vulgare]